VNTAVDAPASQATGRHRGVGGRPVGNSSGVKASVRARVGYQVHDPHHAARSGAGRDPGRVAVA
jgi:hypothetical protein